MARHLTILQGVDDELLDEVLISSLVEMDWKGMGIKDNADDITDQCPIVLLESMDCLTHLSPPAKRSTTKWKKKVLDPRIRELCSRKCCTLHCMQAFDSAMITMLRDCYYSMAEADSRAWLCVMRDGMYDNSYVLSNKVCCRCSTTLLANLITIRNAVVQHSNSSWASATTSLWAWSLKGNASQ